MADVGRLETISDRLFSCSGQQIISAVFRLIGDLVEQFFWFAVDVEYEGCPT